MRSVGRLSPGRRGRGPARSQIALLCEPEQLRGVTPRTSKAGTDQIDALMIARYASTIEGRITVPDAPRKALIDLLSVRDLLVDQTVVLRNCARHVTEPQARDSLAKTLRQFRDQLVQINAAIAAMLSDQAAFAERAEIIASV